MPCNRPPDIVGVGPVHDLNVWRRHPDVVHVYAKPVDDPSSGEFQLRLWLKPGSEDAPATGKRSLTPQPWNAKPDLALFGKGLPHPTFWDRFNPVLDLKVFQEMPCPEAPEGWWQAQVWLAPA